MSVSGGLAAGSLARLFEENKASRASGPTPAVRNHSCDILWLLGLFTRFDDRGNIKEKKMSTNVKAGLG